MTSSSTAYNLDFDLSDSSLLCNDNIYKDYSISKSIDNTDNMHNNELRINQQALDESNYQQLLQSYTDIQITLAQTKSQQSKIIDENEQLHKEKEKLETTVTHLESRLDETKKSLLQYVDSTVLSSASREREKELTRVEMEWRRLVEKERKEIEECKKRCAEQVRDFDKLGYQIAQEVKKDYDDLIETLTKEKAQLEDKYYTMKRNHELLEVQTNVEISTMKKEMESMRKLKDEDISALKETLIHRVEETADSANQLDQLRMDVTEAKTVIETMTIKEREMKKSLDCAIDTIKNEQALKSDVISSYEIELTKMRNNLSSKEILIQSLNSEVDHLRKALEKVNHSLKQLKDELNEEKEKASLLRSQLEKKENVLMQVKNDLILVHQHEMSQLQSELSVLKQENSSLLRNKQNLEVALSVKRNEIKEVTHESILKEESLRREYESSLTLTTLENKKLHEKLSELMCNSKETETDLVDVKDKLARADEIHQHEIGIVKKENDAYSQKCSTLDVSLNELKVQYQQSQEQLEKLFLEIAVQQKKIEVLEENHVDDQAENSILKSKLEKMMKERSVEASQNKNEREQLQAEISSLKAKISTERKKMENILTEKEKSFKNKVDREKKKAECYKEKAIEAHTKRLHIKQLLLKKDGQQS